MTFYDYGVQPITLPDWQTDMRDNAVRDEREACARLAEEHGAHATAVEIRARGEARDIAARPIPACEPTPFDRVMAEAVSRLQRENPPPPDALLPDGCSRWWPRVDVVDREEGVCVRLTWEGWK